ARSLSKSGCVIRLSSDGSMIGSSRLTPIRYDQRWSAIAFAKYGLSGDVTHSASVLRELPPASHFGSLPLRNFAFTALSVPGIMISRPALKFCTGCTPLRITCCWPDQKAANSQNWSCFHFANGCAWHWAHSILTPRNTRDVAPARFSALFSLATK